MADEYPSMFRTFFFQRFGFAPFGLNIPAKKGSEQMSLVQLFVPTEVAHDTVAELGELGNVQFKDVSKTLYIFGLPSHSVLFPS
jgi:hypothetical protein